MWTEWMDGALVLTVGGTQHGATQSAKFRMDADMKVQFDREVKFEPLVDNMRGWVLVTLYEAGTSKPVYQKQIGYACPEPEEAPAAPYFAGAVFTLETGQPPALADRPDDPLVVLVYEAIRFASWAVGEGFSPSNDCDEARDPAHFLMEYWNDTGRTTEWEATPDDIRKIMRELINDKR